MISKMTELEKKYKVKERAEDAVHEHGSVEKAIKHLKTELKEWEDMWSEYSCECLGHGITCNGLLIDWLERGLIQKNIMAKVRTKIELSETDLLDIVVEKYNLKKDGATIKIYKYDGGGDPREQSYTEITVEGETIGKNDITC